MSHTTLPDARETPPLHPLAKAACAVVIVSGTLFTGNVLTGGYLTQQVMEVFATTQDPFTQSPLEEFCGDFPQNPMCQPPGS